MKFHQFRNKDSITWSFRLSWQPNEWRGTPLKLKWVDSTKNKSSYGAQIKNLMVKKEEVEPVEEDGKWGYDKKGNSLNPKDKKKEIKKEDFDAKQSELWDEAAKILT